MHCHHEIRKMRLRLSISAQVHSVSSVFLSTYYVLGILHVLTHLNIIATLLDVLLHSNLGDLHPTFPLPSFHSLEGSDLYLSAFSDFLFSLTWAFLLKKSFYPILASASEETGLMQFWWVSSPGHSCGEKSDFPGEKEERTILSLPDPLRRKGSLKKIRTLCIVVDRMYSEFGG